MMHDNEIVSVGRQLQEARKRAGFSQQDVAKQLCLTSRVVDELESDHFEQNNTFAFTRGYIRSYARLLKLNDDNLLSQLSQQLQPELVEKKLVRNKIEVSSHHLSENMMKSVTYLLIAIFGTLVFLWWHSHSQYLKSAELIDTDMLVSSDDLYPVKKLPIDLADPLTYLNLDHEEK